MDIEYEKKREAAYWRERYNILNAANARLTRQTCDDVERAFELAQRDIQRDIDAWLNRFADNNGVTLVEARRLLNSDELKELKWDVAEYIKRGKENAISGKWAKELENASARLHISRLEALKIRTQNHLETAFAAENNAVENLVKNVYKSNYYHTAFELQKGFGVGFDISGIDERQLDMLIKKPWTVDRRTFSDRIWERKDKMVSALHQEMIRNCIYGRSRKDMTKAMMQFVGKDIKNAEYCAARVIKTETAYFTSQSQRQALSDLDCEMYEVYLPLSPKSCEICREMNGKHFKMSEYEPGMTAPPFHPNCENGSVIPYYEDGFFDNIKGGEKVSEDLTFDEWEEKFVKDNGLTNEGESGMIQGRNKKSEIRKSPEKSHIEYRKVEELDAVPSVEEIISRVGGGDETIRGSCSSVELAYIGNRNGFNVLDFRGGESTKFFAKSGNIIRIANLPSVRSTVLKAGNDIEAAISLLKTVDEDKEYFLATGKHAAIVKKVGKGYYYLELQDSKHNGFKALTTRALKKRFSCKKSHSSYGVKLEQTNVLIDASSLNNNEEFKRILGYINTAETLQKKGAGGYVK